MKCERNINFVCVHICDSVDWNANILQMVFVNERMTTHVKCRWSSVNRTEWIKWRYEIKISTLNLILYIKINIFFFCDILALRQIEIEFFFLLKRSAYVFLVRLDWYAMMSWAVYKMQNFNLRKRIRNGFSFSFATVSVAFVLDLRAQNLLSLFHRILLCDEFFFSIMSVYVPFFVGLCAI